VIALQAHPVAVFDRLALTRAKPNTLIASGERLAASDTSHLNNGARLFLLPAVFPRVLAGLGAALRSRASAISWPEYRPALDAGLLRPDQWRLGWSPQAVLSIVVDASALLGAEPLKATPSLEAGSALVAIRFWRAGASIRTLHRRMLSAIACRSTDFVLIHPFANKLLFRFPYRAILRMESLESILSILGFHVLG
jgi:hypothetical protein